MKINAKKSLGQNFLKDENILKKIANTINTNKDDLIIEIGPGTGALTKHLIAKNSYLLCFEIDTRMQSILSQYENNKTKIIYQDILNTNINEEIKNINYQNIYVMANIPYYITTPIIKKVINIPKLKAMTLLVQKEVGERLSASPGSKSYGSLTVYLNYFFNITYLFDVKNTCFDPQPKVDSALILFEAKTNKNKAKNEEKLFALIKDSFKQKRKTLKNNLKNYNWNIIKEILITNNYHENTRAEELPLDIYIEIANKI